MKKILAGLMLLLLVFNLAACGGKEDPKRGNSEGDASTQAQNTQALSVVTREGFNQAASSDIQDKDILEALKAFSDDKAPSAAKLQEMAETFEKSLPEPGKAMGQMLPPADLSNALQRQYDLWKAGQLEDNSEMANLLKALTTIPGAQSSKTGGGFGSAGLGGSGALEDIYTSQLDPKTTLLIYETTFLKPLTESVVTEAYQGATSAYKNLMGADRQVPVVIHISYLDMNLESFSIDTGSEFHIHINGLIGSNLIKGSLAHELFHAYQKDLGHKRDNGFVEWMMEAQAIWAVTYYDEALGYHHRYTPYIYEEMSMEAADLKLVAWQSWYQLYYFLGDEHSSPDTVVDLAKKTMGSQDLYALLYKNQGMEHRVNNLMAQFTQFLFETRDDDNRVFMPDSPLAENTFNPTLFENLPVEHFQTEGAEDPHQETLQAPGFYLFQFEAPQADYLLTVFKELAQARRTTMILYGSRDGKWHELMNGRHDEFVCNVDFRKDGYGDLALILVHYGTGLDRAGFRWDLQEKQRAEGSMVITMEKTRNLLGQSYKKVEHLIINEDIERFASDTGTDPNNPAGAMLSLVAGQLYEIVDLQMSYDGTTDYDITDEYGNRETMTKIASGTYTYNQANSNMIFENPLLNLPMPSLSGSPGGSALGGSGLGDLMSQLPAGVMDQVGGEIASAQAGLEAAEAELAEAASGLGGVLPPMNALVRIKDNSPMDTFNFYMTMPLDIGAKTWVREDTIHTKTTHDGDSNTAVSAADIIPPIFAPPLWFINPDFNEAAQKKALDNIKVSPQMLMGSISGGSLVEGTSLDIAKQVAAVNGAYDKFNVHSLLNAGPVTLGTSKGADFSQQTQSLSLVDGLLSGWIEAEYIDAEGYTVKVRIDVHYEF